MTFGLLWRLKWRLRRMLMCPTHHCQGKPLHTDEGSGWQCGTCGCIKHWSSWRDSVKERHVIGERGLL